jgi:hypothetical protein
MHIRGRNGALATAHSSGDDVAIELVVSSPTPLRAPRFGIAVSNARGDRVFAVATYLSPKPIDRVGKASKVQVSFRLPPLYPDATRSTSASRPRRAGSSDQGRRAPARSRCFRTAFSAPRIRISRRWDSCSCRARGA